MENENVYKAPVTVTSQLTVLRVLLLSIVSMTA